MKSSNDEDVSALGAVLSSLMMITASGSESESITIGCLSALRLFDLDSVCGGPRKGKWSGSRKSEIIDSPNLRRSVRVAWQRYAREAG